MSEVELNGNSHADGWRECDAKWKKHLNKVSEAWWAMTDEEFKHITSGRDRCSLCVQDGIEQCKPQHVVAKVLGNIAMDWGDDE